MIVPIKSVTVTLPPNVLIDRESYPKLVGYNKWWISKRGDVITQKESGSRTNRNRITYKLHRVIMDAPKGLEVDHINRNRLDNRVSNLRLCKHAENGRNLRRNRKNASIFTGITWDKRRSKWHTRLKLNYKDLHLGYYGSLEEAISARLFAEDYYFGEFAPNA